MWRLIAPIVGLIGGLLIAASAESARGTDLRAGRLTELSELIREASQRNQQLERRVVDLGRQVEALSEDRARHDEQVSRAHHDVDRLQGPAGLLPVSGPAVTVTLDDAPPGAINKRIPGLPEPQPDFLVVHQQDVQAVVNALWAGGAQAIQVMDQRLISLSAVRCVGNTLILRGRVYSPPYKITAVGDPDRLRAALEASEPLRIYREYVRAYGLGYQVDERSSATIPGYQGSLDLKYARVPE
ncbi:membrane protein [Carbonactinospora thermoautotrophica]|uniref:Membrane protein n=1 Tax=Carbonactinospora thermoautotrophica TaxID=1469144 RepID=A0A132NBQ6_9ACTN|nr:membrane protein [Carbonactinospora thermoautotrophica]KWX07601.1 membrane protein [Carbonactinospora thermoautotrophica]